MSDDPFHKAAARTARRIGVLVVGTALMLVGLVLTVTPGPAVVVFGLALAVLATEFAWARRWLHRLRESGSLVLARVRGREPGESDRSREADT